MIAMVDMRPKICAAAACVAHPSVQVEPFAHYTSRATENLVLHIIGKSLITRAGAYINIGPLAAHGGLLPTTPATDTLG